MSDYIKREDAIKALCDICETLLRQIGEDVVDKESKGKCPIIKAIPTADVVEVVRCKDCKYFVPISEKIGECKDTRMNSTYMSFCSYGERKNNE